MADSAAPNSGSAAPTSASSATTWRSTAPTSGSAAPTSTSSAPTSTSTSSATTWRWRSAARASTSAPSPGAGLDATHVFNLVLQQRPYQLLEYIDSFPDSFGDPQCVEIRLIGKALLPEERRRDRDPPEEYLRSRLNNYPFPDLASGIEYLARLAWSNASNCRLRVPQISSISTLDSDARNLAKPTSTTRTPPTFSNQMNAFYLKSSSSRSTGNFPFAQENCDSKGKPWSDAKQRSSSRSTGNFPFAQENCDSKGKPWSDAKQRSSSRSTGNFPFAQENCDSKGELRSDAKTIASSRSPSKLPGEKRSSDSSLSFITQQQNWQSEDKGHKSVAYNCPWSTFLVPAGCGFPALSAASPFLRVYSPVVSTKEEERIKQQFLVMLAMSPEWWRRLLQHGRLPDRDPEAALRALTSPHISRDRPLVGVKHLCDSCSKQEGGGEAKGAAADWVTSCCNPSLRLCSGCLASAYLCRHGPCMNHGAIGLLPGAREAVMQRMMAHEDETLYCMEESTLLVQPEYRGVEMMRDGFCMRRYARLGDVHARTAAVRTSAVLFHISRAGGLMEVCRTPLALDS